MEYRYLDIEYSKNLSRYELGLVDRMFDILSLIPMSSSTRCVDLFIGSGIIYVNTTGDDDGVVVNSKGEYAVTSIDIPYYYCSQVGEERLHYNINSAINIMRVPSEAELYRRLYDMSSPLLQRLSRDGRFLHYNRSVRSLTSSEYLELIADIG